MKAAIMPRRAGAEFFPLLLSTTPVPTLLLEQSCFQLNTQSLKTEELVPAQRRGDVLPRERTTSITCRMPPNVRAERDLEPLKLLSPLAPFDRLENRGSRGREAHPGPLPDFQDGVVPLKGLQEGFCPSVGDAVVGEPGRKMWGELQGRSAALLGLSS